MTKSAAYMLVAVVVGYMLVSAVPGQIAMYATPQQTLSLGIGGDGSTTTVESGELEGSLNTTVEVEMYYDSTGNLDENASDDHEIWFEVANGTGRGGSWNGTTGSDEIGQVEDLNAQISDLSEQLVNVSGEFEIAKSDIEDVAAIAAEAVEAAEAASEAVESVAATANSASQAAADAAVAAEASRDASSGLTTLSMVGWYVVDVLFAVGVYFLARRRFT